VEDDYKPCPTCGEHYTTENGVEVTKSGAEHSCKDILFERGAWDAVKLDVERGHYHDHAYGI